MPRYLVFIVFTLLLTGCSLLNGENQTAPIESVSATQMDPIAVRTAAAATIRANITADAAQTPTPQPSSTDDPFVVSVRTAAAATAFFQLTELGAVPSTTPALTLTPTIYPTLTFIPSSTSTYPTQLPPISPALLKTKLAIQPEAFNGHAIQKITGWDYGFLGYEWMDEKHLLLSAITGPRGEVSKPQNYPGVINLDSKRVWIPFLTNDAAEGRMIIGATPLPRWSKKLGALITTETISSGEAVMLYSADGDFLAVYAGKLQGISPSGTKILVGNGIWIDLISGKEVAFHWDKQYLDPIFSHPNWSKDENQVVTCCHLYGNAKTGESYNFLTSDDELFGYGTWVLNDNYFIPDCCYVYGLPQTLSPGYVPLFDPPQKSFLKVSEIAGVAFNYGNQCTDWSIAPNRKYVLAKCFDGGHLLDLATFKGQHYPQLSSGMTGIDWSDDSNFVWLRMVDDSKKILSVTSGELKPVPDDHNCSWLPTDNTLLCLSNKSQTVSLLDARTVNIQKSLAFTSRIQNFLWAPNNKLFIISNDGQTISLLDAKTFTVQKELVSSLSIQWLFPSPAGKTIAFLAQDGSFWQFDYPTLENLEQITPAKPSLSNNDVYRYRHELKQNVSWSPDGNSLAFIADKDIYIVETASKP